MLNLQISLLWGRGGKKKEKENNFGMHIPPTL